MLFRLWQVSHILRGRGGEDGIYHSWRISSYASMGALQGPMVQPGPSCVTFGKSLTLSVFQSAGLTDGNSDSISLSQRVVRGNLCKEEGTEVPSSLVLAIPSGQPQQK